jgi:hypothetical protein
MREILKKVIEETTEIVKSFNLTKVIFYWNIPHNGVYTKCLNEKDEEIVSLSDDLALGNINPNLFSNFFILVEEIKKEQKINKGTLTIYPSGEYKSLFIWDKAADLEKLVFKAENLFSLLYYEISACPAFKNAEEEPISWQEAIVTVLFKSGKVQPLNVEVKTATNEIIYYSEAIEEEFGESEYQSSRQYYEETYYLMNEGELKALYPRWNVATIHIKYGVRFDFEKHIILEWREENA